ncbi:MAG: DUF11 domain-containing protein [Acidobacteria bacterium]|nr:DUF11 domain-containing protein [Acidobacteriota bacterium]MBV9475698.1 DUF11 domain-containing protein [Acidobacteriota bacterium]
MNGLRPAAWISLLLSFLVAPFLYGAEVHLTVRPPAGVRQLTAAELHVRNGRVEVDAMPDDVALDPRLIAAVARQHGTAELELQDSARLEGRWSLPSGTFRIHSRGDIRADDCRLDGPGSHLRLEARNIALRGATQLDLARRDGAGGELTLIGTDGIDIDARATIDASGAEGDGGRILLHASDVRSRGTLRALGRGRIEVEARRAFAFTSHADTGGGVVRLDPTNIIIGSFSGTNTGISVAGGDVSPSAATGQLDAGNLVALLATNDVIVHTTSAAGPGTGLQAAITGDTTDGDISVEAEVVWNSAHSLWLLAHDDLIVQRAVQNAGAGSVAGIAGWDGTTTTGIDGAVVAASAYGNGTGDAFVMGTGTTLFAPGAAFGSRQQATAVRARNVSVLGSTAAVLSDSFGMIGYHIIVANDSANGPIHVAAKGTLTMTAAQGIDRFRYAQIGHGGPVDIAQSVGVNQGNLAGAIDVTVAGAITMLGGKSLGYCQIGHGGDLRQGATRGTAGGDISVTGASLSMTGAGGSGSATYVQIGHGGGVRFGASHQGNLSGNITVDISGDVTLDNRPQFGLGDVMIGHGGNIVTTTDSGNAALAPATLGTQTGDIHVNAANLAVFAGTHSGTGQIGHGGVLYGVGQTGAATGDIAIHATGYVHVTGGSDVSVRSLTYAQIGHGGGINGNVAGKTAVRGAVSGAITITADGDVEVRAGSNLAAYAQIGNGGGTYGLQGGATLTSASGALTVEANHVLVQGGPSLIGYAQIGHGGEIYQDGNDAATQGPLSGALSVIAHTNLDVLAGTDDQGTDYAQVGHGGAPFNGSGFGPTQAGVTGSCSITVTGETSLVDVPALPNPPNMWWLGHRTLGTLSSAPVSLTTGTLDFVAGPGATNATISDAQFWPRFVGDAADETDNAVGGEVTLNVRGSGSDGNLIVQQPLVVPAAVANRVQAISSDDLTIGASITNNGSSNVDLVADDANPLPPNFSPTALFTINSGATISGNVRLFAVSHAQFFPGTYTPPATAFSVWHDQSGVPVVGINFKAAPAADVSVTKTDSPDPVTPGNNLTYSIGVTNSGPDAAATVSLTDTLPAGTTFVSLASPGGWSCTTPVVGNGGTVTCTIASFTGGASFTLVVNVDPAATASSTISNTASVSSSTADTNNGNDSATSTTTVGAASADLSVTKTDAPDPVTPGNDLTYTITVANAGPSVASTVALTDALPSGTTFVSLSSPAGWSCTMPSVGSNGTVTCNATSFTAGNAAFTLVVNVDPAQTGTISNTASVTSATADPNTGNESATSSTTVDAPSADVSIAKVDTPDPVTPGSNLTYTITVTNGGPSVASTLAMTDTLPSGTTFVSLASPAGWSCTTPAVGASGTVTCNATTLVVGDAVFTLVVNVDAAQTTTISNTASVTSATTDPNPGNESATAATALGTATADLAITKTDDVDPVTPGTNLTYTITTMNAGPSNAASVQLTDTLPAGTTFVSLASPGGWSCTTPAVGANGSITCSIGVLTPGNAVFTLVVHVGSTVAPATVLSNTATVTSSTSDPNTGNESATQTTTVGAASADLSITKSGSPDPITPDNDLTYTITVANAGPSVASTLAVSDTLPTGTTFVSLASPGGWSCTTPAVGAAGTVNCTNASFDLGNAVFTLVVHVGASVSSGTILNNTATVTSSTADPNTGNETAKTATTVGSSVTADLAVSKTATPDPVTPNADLTYTITVTNAGPSTATGVSLTDALPANTTFVSFSKPAAWSATTPAAGGTGTVTATLASMPPGSAVFTLVVHVGAAVTPGTTISNTAVVSSATTDPAPGNESATATTNVVAPTSVIVHGTKSASGTFQAGSTVTYTIVLTNSGASAQTNNSGNEFTDVLPAALTLVNASASSGTATATVATNTVTWNGGIAAGGSVTITIHATINPAAPPGTLISNQGTFMYDSDANGTNDTSGVTDDASVAGGTNPTVFAVAAAASAAVIPTASTYGLLFLAAALFGLALLRLR